MEEDAWVGKPINLEEDYKAYKRIGGTQTYEEFVQHFLDNF